MHTVILSPDGCTISSSIDFSSVIDLNIPIAVVPLPQAVSSNIVSTSHPNTKICLVKF
ncbi:MAG: hypothetical protein LBV42_01710 [Methanobrevibacter sp.]|nr:hypothetical protein [Methanobrevibacter sp.]